MLQKRIQPVLCVAEIGGQLLDSRPQRNCELFCGCLVVAKYACVCLVQEMHDGMRRTSALAWASTNKRAVGRTLRHRILFWQVLLLLAKNETMENCACVLENQLCE